MGIIYTCKYLTANSTNHQSKANSHIKNATYTIPNKQMLPLIVSPNIPIIANITITTNKQDYKRGNVPTYCKTNRQEKLQSITRLPWQCNSNKVHKTTISNTEVTKQNNLQKPYYI